MALVLVWRPVLAAAWVMQPICRVIGAVLGHPRAISPAYYLMGISVSSFLTKTMFRFSGSHVSCKKWEIIGNYL